MAKVSWLDDSRTPALVEEYKKKGVSIEEKTGWFWNTITWMLYIITFTIYKREKFLKHFATTIGNKVGFPREWSFRQVDYVMPHEARHVWQGKMCGLGISPWLGLPLFGVIYILLPIPVGCAYFRYLFERDATRVTTKRMKDQGKSIEDAYKQAVSSAKKVSSSDYLWSVPQSFAVKGYKKMVRDVWSA